MSAVVLFDGVCNLCNGAVDFIIEHDSRGRFRFASLQSEAARPLLAECGLAPGLIDTIVLCDGDVCHVRSTAALRIARRLDPPWCCLYVLMVVPRWLRDAAYDWLAMHRYRWFGRRSICRVPTEELRRRFL